MALNGLKREILKCETEVSKTRRSNGGSSVIIGKGMGRQGG